MTLSSRVRRHAYDLGRQRSRAYVMMLKCLADGASPSLIAKQIPGWYR